MFAPSITLVSHFLTTVSVIVSLTDVPLGVHASTAILRSSPSDGRLVSPFVRRISSTVEMPKAELLRYEAPHKRGFEAEKVFGSTGGSCTGADPRGGCSAQGLLSSRLPARTCCPGIPKIPRQKSERFYAERTVAGGRECWSPFRLDAGADEFGGDQTIHDPVGAAAAFRWDPWEPPAPAKLAGVESIAPERRSLSSEKAFLSDVASLFAAEVGADLVRPGASVRGPVGADGGSPRPAATLSEPSPDRPSSRAGGPVPKRSMSARERLKVPLSEFPSMGAGGPSSARGRPPTMPKTITPTMPASLATTMPLPTMQEPAHGAIPKRAWEQIEEGAVAGTPSSSRSSMTTSSSSPSRGSSTPRRGGSRPPTMPERPPATKMIPPTVIPTTSSRHQTQTEQLQALTIEDLPAPKRIPNPSENPHTFAFGDFHGDYERFRGLLQGAGVALLPESLDNGAADRAQIQWLAGTSQIVIMGDVVDKGPRPFSIYTAVFVLKELAFGHGGKLHLLFGNHEQMRIGGDYSQAGSVEEFR